MGEAGPELTEEILLAPPTGLTPTHKADPSPRPFPQGPRCLQGRRLPAQHCLGARSPGPRARGRALGKGRGWPPLWANVIRSGEWWSQGPVGAVQWGVGVSALVFVTPSHPSLHLPETDPEV